MYGLLLDISLDLEHFHRGQDIWNFNASMGRCICGPGCEPEDLAICFAWKKRLSDLYRCQNKEAMTLTRLAGSLSVDVAFGRSLWDRAGGSLLVRSFSLDPHALWSWSAIFRQGQSYRT